MTRNKTDAGCYTLWLLLCEEDEAWVRGLITRLSSELGTQAFFPHVTLIGGLSGDGEQVAEDLRDLSKLHTAFDAEIAGIDMTSQFFTAFFLRLKAHPDLDALYRQAQNFGSGSMYPPENFMPHISLAYGQIDQEIKRSLQARLEDEFSQRSVRFDRLAYAYSGKGIAISQWRIDHCAELA